MKLGQRERDCAVEVALGREGLALTASLPSPASSCIALWNMLLNLSPSLYQSLEIGIATNFHWV